MEPTPAACRHKRMFADTDAIRVLGAANSAHADDLADIAATLASLSLAEAKSPLGPVGSRFLAALSDAVDEGARAASAISEQLHESSVTTNTVANAYDSTDGRGAGRIAGV
jgi:hypothetical protein